MPAVGVVGAEHGVEEGEEPGVRQRSLLHCWRLEARGQPGEARQEAGREQSDRGLKMI